MTIIELGEIINELIEKGEGYSKVLLSSDSEGNTYSNLLYEGIGTKLYVPVEYEDTLDVIICEDELVNWKDEPLTPVVVFYT